MSARGARGLSEEDRVLWNLVARTTRPLKGTPPAPEPPVASARQPAASPKATVPAPPPAADPRRKHVFHTFDGQTRDKLGKGKLQLEGRVDLHGMTQETAHSLLLSFLRRAYEADVRYVLVITGKGSSFGSEGVLRRAVPGWLATPLFRALVSGHDDATRHHGGSGALYVRLRRKARPGP